jgi:hypothetical protein
MQFWKTAIIGMQKATDVTLILFTIGKALKWDATPLGSTLIHAKMELKGAITDLAKCRKQATELHSAFLDDRIEAAAIAEDTTKEKMLKKIKHREAQTKCFKRL